MYITIKYFGQIAEITNIEEETLEVSGHLISDVLKALNTKYSALKTKDFKVAQNQELVSLETPLNGQDIALLPPFAGG